jgi:hypothetical protein
LTISPVLIRLASLPPARTELDAIGSPRPVLVVIGGAAGLDAQQAAIAAKVIDDVAMVAAVEAGAAIVDGGTDSGVMRLVGQAYAASSYRGPLVGVAVESLVRIDTVDPQTVERVAIESHHTHLVLVEGREWGDESPWLASVAGVLAGPHPSATLLINGGSISLRDVRYSLDARRPVIVAAGTGRLADELASRIAEGNVADLIGDADPSLLHVFDDSLDARTLLHFLQ